MLEEVVFDNHSIRHGPSRVLRSRLSIGQGYTDHQPNKEYRNPRKQSFHSPPHTKIISLFGKIEIQTLNKKKRRVQPAA